MTVEHQDPNYPKEELPITQPVPRPAQPLLKRNKQVKLLLNTEELGRLDQKAVEMGLDRSSVIGHLLISSIPKKYQDIGEGIGEDGPHTFTKIEVTDKGAKQSGPSIMIVFPRSFDELPAAVLAIREGSALVTNLTMMEPDQAQRSVDWASGATFYGEGHQERLGESVFLFAPKEWEVLSVISDEIGGNDGDKQLITSGSANSQDNEEQSDYIKEQQLKNLTSLQATALKLVEDRWMAGNLETTCEDLVANQSPNPESKAALRLARRVLNSLAKLGLVVLCHTGDMVSVKPVIIADALSDHENVDPYTSVDTIVEPTDEDEILPAIKSMGENDHNNIAAMR